MGDVEPGTVEGGICNMRSQYLHYRVHAPSPGLLLGLNDEGRHPRTDNHALPPPVEGEGRLRDVLFGGKSSQGQKRGPEPFDIVLRCGIIGPEDYHPLASALLDPVLGYADGKCGGRAGRIHLGVRTLGLYVLGELRMSHRQHLEHEQSGEMIFLHGFLRGLAVPLLQLLLQPGPGKELAEPLVYPLPLLPHGLRYLLTVIFRHFMEQVVVSRERGGKQYTRVLLHLQRELPSLGKEGPR